MIGSGFFQKASGAHLVNALASRRRRRRTGLPAKSASILKSFLIKSGFVFFQVQAATSTNGTGAGTRGS